MIKKLANSIREYRKPAILTPTLVMLEVILEVIIPILMARLIDFGIDAGNMGYILKMGFMLLASAFMSLIFGALAGKYAAQASSGFAKNLRKDMYDNVQNFSFKNIDKFSTASIVTRLTTDVTNVQQSFQMITRMAIRAPLLLVFSLFAAFSIDAKLSMIFVYIMPVLAVGLFFVIRSVYPIFTRVFKTYDKLNNVVGENLSGIRVVKSFNREDFEREKFNNISNGIYKDFVKAEKALALNMPLMQACMYAALLLISWFGARAIVASGANAAFGLSTGELMSLITYATQILVGLMMLSMVLVMITLSRASAERIVELLEEKNDLVNAENPIFEVKNGDIVFENVDFKYSDKAGKLVLDNINLKINSGETIGIIGSTGSSKTSLVQLIPRLYDVTNGKVSVGGVDVKNIDIETLRNDVAVVLQKNVLFSGTINENLRWGNENATEQEIINACDISQASSFIENFDKKYDSYIEQGGSNVSGGQKQRLCIARALLKKPKIIIFDDSTSAVDTKTDTLIRQGLSEEIPNTTKIIIAQRVSSIMDADKIIVMDDGKISAIGTHDQLLQASDIYKEVYTSQQKGGIGDE